MRFESCALLGPLGSGWLDVRLCCAERPVVLEEEGLLAVRRRCVEGTDFSTAAPLGACCSRGPSTRPSALVLGVVGLGPPPKKKPN